MNLPIAYHQKDILIKVTEAEETFLDADHFHIEMDWKAFSCLPLKQSVHFSLIETITELKTRKHLVSQMSAVNLRGYGLQKKCVPRCWRWCGTCGAASLEGSRAETDGCCMAFFQLFFFGVCRI